MPSVGLNRNSHRTAAIAGATAYGQISSVLYTPGTADDAIGEHGEHQRYGEPEAGDEERKNRRDLERREIQLVVEQVAEIVEADELQAAAEGILYLQSTGYSACPAGRKKNTMVTTTCGSNSA